MRANWIAYRLPHCVKAAGLIRNIKAISVLPTARRRGTKSCSHTDHGRSQGVVLNAFERMCSVVRRKRGVRPSRLLVELPGDPNNANVA
jgi:hypothetical protein